MWFLQLLSIAPTCLVFLGASLLLRRSKSLPSVLLFVGTAVNLLTSVTLLSFNLGLLSPPGGVGMTPFFGFFSSISVAANSCFAVGFLLYVLRPQQAKPSASP